MKSYKLNDMANMSKEEFEITVNEIAEEMNKPLFQSEDDLKEWLLNAVDDYIINENQWLTSDARVLKELFEAYQSYHEEKKNV